MSRLRKGALATMAMATALSSSLGVGFANGEPAPSETLFEWVQGTPDTLRNGEVAQAQFWTNANQKDGSGDMVPLQVEFTISKGGFVELPSACGEGSTLSPKKDAMTCKLGAVPGGTAASFNIPVRASGVNGDSVKITAAVDGRPVVLRPIQITSVTGIDLWFETAGNYPGVGGSNTNPPITGQWAHPLMIAMPIGAANLVDHLEFDMTVTNKQGVPATSVLSEPQQLFDVPKDHAGFPSALAHSCSPVNPDLTMQFTKTGDGTWHVVVDGFNTDPALSFSRSYDGHQLDVDRVWLDAGCIGFGLDAKQIFTQGNIWTYDLALSNVKASHVTGQVANDLGTYTKVEPWQLTYGSVRSGFPRNHYSTDTLGQSVANPNDGIGGQNDGQALAAPSDRIMANVTSALDYAVASAPETQYCLIADPGKTFFQEGKLRGTYAGWDFKFQYSTTPVTDPGNTDCGKLTFQDQPPSDWSTITAVKIVPGTARAIGDNPLSEGMRPNLSAISAEMRTSDALRPGDHVWTYGTYMNASGAWLLPGQVNAFDTQVGTTFFTDRATVVPARISSDKTCQPTVVAPGETTQCTVTARIAGSSTTATLVDTLPEGWTVVDGGTLVDGKLTWTEQIEKNGTRSWTYVARAPEKAGSFENLLHASIPVQIPQQEPFASSDDRALLTVKSTGLTHLVKEVAAGEFAINAKNTWRLTLQNASDTQSKWSILDILPYNGDGRGTSFTGSYSIDDVRADGASVYYSDADPTTLSPRPEDNDLSQWTTTKPSKVTAIWIVGDAQLGSGASVAAEIDFTTEGNKGEDRYVNRAVAQLPETTILQMIRAEDTTTAKPSSPLQVDKTLVGASRAVIGETLTWTGTVHNPNKGPLNNVVATELVGKGLELVEMADASQGAVTDGVWNIGTLAGGASATVTIKAKITAEADLLGGVENKITVSNPDFPKDDDQCIPNPDVHGDSDQCDLDVFKENSQLKIDKQVSKVDAATGAIEWTITGLNVGPDQASAVVISDVQHEGVTDVKLVETSKGTIDGSKVLVGDLAAGEQVSVTLTGTITDQTKPATNRATIENPTHPVHPNSDCEGNDGVASDDDQCDHTSYQEDSQLRINKEIVSIDPATGTIEWKVTGVNLGPDTARAVTITDVQHDNVEQVQFVEATKGEWADGKLVVGDLALNEEVSMTLTGQIVDPTKPATNRATIENPSNPVDPNQECKDNLDLALDDDQCDHTSYQENSGLKIDKKVASVDPVTGRIEWIITGMNVGPDTASQVTITDVDHVGVKDVTIEETSKGEIDGNRVKVGDLASGEQVKIKLSGTIIDQKVEVTNIATIENPANPGSGGEECVANEDVASDDDQCDKASYMERSGLKIDKQVSKFDPATGAIEWTITGLNVGPDTARAVTISDTKRGNVTDVKLVKTSKGEIDGDKVMVGDLANGESVTIQVTGKVVDATKASRNTVTIENPAHPFDPNAQCKVNEGVDSDDDQCDESETPGMTPPATPSDPGKPIRTGDVPDADGDWTAAALAGAAGVGLIGAAGVALVRRRRSQG